MDQQDQKLRNFYLESKINSATPEQMVVMLYEGLVDFAEQAEREIAEVEKNGQGPRAAHYIARCLDILTELSASLRPDPNPELSGTLANLYQFFAQQFSKALEEWNSAPIRAILPLMQDLRSTWVEASKVVETARLIAA